MSIFEKPETVRALVEKGLASSNSLTVALAAALKKALDVDDPPRAPEQEYPEPEESCR